MSLLNDSLEAIDAANAEDPNQLRGVPLALVQGRLASIWLERLAPDAEAPVVIAARAHHLRRWELARSDYPDGRVGYRRWRADNKMVQANAAADIMATHGWGEEAINRVGNLLIRQDLGTDPDTQLIEDVACLVFIETQFDDMVNRLGHEHMVSVVARTIRKMSDNAIALAGEVTLSPESAAVLTDAVASLAAE